MILRFTPFYYSFLLLFSLVSCSDWTRDFPQKKLYIAPVVETLDVVGQAGTNSVQVQAKITNVIEAPLSRLGICFSVNQPIPTIADQTVWIDKDFEGTKTFFISGLAPNQRYTYRTYAISKAQPNLPAYGVVKSFTTTEILSIVETLGTVGPVSPSSVSAVMQLNNFPQVTPSEIGICYSISNPLPTLADNVVRNRIQNEFRATNIFVIKSLAPNTTYYYRGYAVNQSKPDQPVLGNVLVFKTDPR